MSSKYEYSQFNGSGEVSDEAGSVDIVSNPGSVTYLNIERGSISISRAADGGGGYVRIQDTLGNVIYTVSADGVKDFPFDWGDEGKQIGPDVGIQVITAGAQNSQATASVVVNGHRTFRVKKS